MRLYRIHENQVLKCLGIIYGGWAHSPTSLEHKSGICRVTQLRYPIEFLQLEMENTRLYARGMLADMPTLDRRF